MQINKITPPMRNIALQECSSRMPAILDPTSAPIRPHTKVVDMAIDLQNNVI